MTEYLLERKLKEEAPELHRRVHDSIAVFHAMLRSYMSWFPEFTDHSVLHSLNVLDYCNRLLTQERVRLLSSEECYALIMSCYLHDSGMGINDKDLTRFSGELGLGVPADLHGRRETAAFIRDNHHEFSALFIRKYADLFEIPTEALKSAVIRISRGHRRTDLFDAEEYADIPTSAGRIRTAYLTAVLRLADDIDVADGRNPGLLYDTSTLTEKKDIEVFGTHESVRRVEVEEDRILLYVRPKAPEYVPLLDRLRDKIQDSLDTCREAARRMSDMTISQKEVLLVKADG